MLNQLRKHYFIKLMRQILSLKNWQIFLLLLLTTAWTSPSPLNEIIHFIGVTIFITWIYGIGYMGRKKIKKLELPTIDIRLFKANALLIPILTAILMLRPGNLNANFKVYDIIFIPLGLYFLFALLQTVMFASRTLNTIELKRKASFSDAFETFLFMIFYIIGIWSIQPKVNQLLTNEEPVIV
jgi:nitrate reductase gamma subunit